MGRVLRLSDHTHAAHIYAAGQEQADIAAAFFRAALRDGRRCAYVHDQTDDATAVRKLAVAGLDVGGALGSAAFTIPDRGLLPRQPGEFHPEEILGLWGQLVDGAVADGYQGLAGLGDMSWTLVSDPGMQRLIDYENHCTNFATTHSTTAICQYDRGRFDDRALFDVLFTHPWLIIAGTVCQNPYCVPSHSFAERDPGELDLDRVLGDILARERQERWLAAADDGLENPDAASQLVDVSHLAAIYEHMRDYKRALRERIGRRQDRNGGRSSVRAELTALDAEIEWLAARASLWRRRQIQSAGLFFEPTSGTLAYRGRAVGLSQLESALLRTLLEEAGRPCSASQLIRIAWEGDVRTEAQLRNYVVRLRGKLRTLGVPASIEALRGRGYVLAMARENGAEHP